MKFVIAPQKIRSRNDFDKHYISADRLIKLYGVNRSECVVLLEDDPLYDIKRERYRDLIWLTPLYKGNYSEALEQELQRITRDS